MRRRRSANGSPQSPTVTAAPGETPVWARNGESNIGRDPEGLRRSGGAAPQPPRTIADFGHHDNRRPRPPKLDRLGVGGARTPRHRSTAHWLHRCIPAQRTRRAGMPRHPARSPRRCPRANQALEDRPGRHRNGQSAPVHRPSSILSCVCVGPVVAGRCRVRCRWPCRCHPVALPNRRIRLPCLPRPTARCGQEGTAVSCDPQERQPLDHSTVGGGGACGGPTPRQSGRLRP